MTTEKILPYGRQTIDAFDITDMSEALSGEIITRGPHVEEFESTVAKECGVDFAIAFCNGTAALEATYFAADLTSYDRVVTTANTFVGTIVGALKTGADIVFADLDRSNGCFSLEKAEPNLDYRSTRGKLVVVPVHFSGIAMDVHTLRSMARHPSSIIIEDAAHAIGSQYPNGEKVGSCAFSDMTIFSFHPVKTITTGEGGMVTTNDPVLAKKLKMFRQNGIVRPEGREPWYYEVHAATGNYNLTDFQGALGTSQMHKLKQFVDKRRALVKKYRELLGDFEGIRLFDAAFDDRTAYHLFVVQIDFDQFPISKVELVGALRSRGVGSQVHYVPLYRHPVCAIDAEEWNNYFPETEAYYRSALSLPLYPDLTEADIEHVCGTLKELLKGARTRG